MCPRSYSVCPWQGFAGQCNVALQIIGPICKLRRKWSVVNTIQGLHLIKSLKAVKPNRFKEAPSIVGGCGRTSSTSRHTQLKYNHHITTEDKAVNLTLQSKAFLSTMTLSFTMLGMLRKFATLIRNIFTDISNTFFYTGILCVIILSVKE
jgi:hypothetical protein